MLEDGGLLGSCVETALEPRTAQGDFKGIVDRGGPRRVGLGLGEHEAHPPVESCADFYEVLGSGLRMLKHVGDRFDKTGEPGGIHLREARVVHLENERHGVAGELDLHAQEALVVEFEPRGVERDQGVCVPVGIELDAGHAKGALRSSRRRMVKVSVLPERAGEKDALKRLACRHELEGVKDDGIIGTLDIGAQKPFAGLVKASLACAKNAEQIKKADVPFVFADPGDGAARCIKGSAAEQARDRREREQKHAVGPVLHVRRHRLKNSHRAREGGIPVGTEQRLCESERGFRIGLDVAHVEATGINALVHDALDELEDPLGLLTRGPECVNGRELRSCEDHHPDSCSCFETVFGYLTEGLKTTNPPRPSPSGRNGGHGFMSGMHELKSRPNRATRTAGCF